MGKLKTKEEEEGCRQGRWGRRRVESGWKKEVEKGGIKRGKKEKEGGQGRWGSVVTARA